jgi:hypothetical protein
MTRILAFSGKKQSGKSTSSNFIHGYQLRAFGIIENFAITDKGELLIKSKNEDGYGLLDAKREDDEFAEWAIYNMWPYIKSYSLAAPLKTIATELFDINPENVYGTNEQKNEKIEHLRWENMPGVVTESWLLNQLEEDFPTLGLKYHKPGPMTAREFMQFLGTDVMRKMYDNVWCGALIKTVKHQSPLLAVVDDVRFENEVKAIQDAGGKVIRLTRSENSDDHPSETGLDNYNNFDGVIENENLEIQETNKEIISLLGEWGWLGEEIPTVRDAAKKTTVKPLAKGSNK